jgi:hypothetical protein
MLELELVVLEVVVEVGHQIELLVLVFVKVMIGHQQK